MSDVDLEREEATFGYSTSTPSRDKPRQIGIGGVDTWKETDLKWAGSHHNKHDELHVGPNLSTNRKVSVAAYQVLFGIAP